jgi:lysophospholipase L1-like esterase
MKKLLLVLLTCFATLANAQTKVSLNYYSQETFDALGLTAAQQSALTAIRNETTEKIKAANANANLSEAQKKAAITEAYKEGGIAYSNALNPEQKTKLSGLHQKIAQQNLKLGIKPPINTNYKNAYYDGRMDLFRSLPLTSKGIVFLGNSITERGMWHELFPGKLIQNRGIGGDNTFGILSRLDEIIKSKPEKVFLMIGVNDMARGFSVDLILKNYNEITSKIISGSPATKIYVQSMLPLNDDLIKAASYKNKVDSVKKYNTALAKIAKDRKFTYVNLHDQFLDKQGKLDTAYTTDGVHINPKAYAKWAEFLRKEKHL